MRTKFWNRLLIAFCGLVTLAFGAGLFAYGAGFFPFHWDLSQLDIPYEPWQRAVIIGVALALAAVGIYGICVLFRRGREKGFIIQRTEFGDMSISINALQNMVKKCVQTHSELTAGTTRITRSRDSVVISIKVTLSGGANIPLTVNALQKQIKQYITSCSGVDVKEVRVMVETNLNKLETPAPAAESEAEEPKANGIFSHTEEPSVYTGGAVEPVKAPEADAKPDEAHKVESPADDEAEQTEESAAADEPEAAYGRADDEAEPSNKDEGEHNHNDTDE